jgi:hypothetical protein
MNIEYIQIEKSPLTAIIVLLPWRANVLILAKCSTKLQITCLKKVNAKIYLEGNKRMMMMIMMMMIIIIISGSAAQRGL